MTDYKPEVNAGVHANIGMDFQKNCTIFLFLEKYHELKGQRYFVILEHLEDIVFGFLQNDTNLTKVETYQAKKSSTKWTTSGLLELIKKITETSQAVLNDSHPKTLSFYQENYFATNNTIELSCKIKQQKYSCTVNEASIVYKFKDLDQNIKDKLVVGNTEVKFTAENVANLEHLHFRFIDLGRTTKSQLNQLHGMFASVFGNSISDHKAALNTFYYALEEIERELNQGNVAKLSDNKKRIESYEIERIVGTLTNKKLAYDFWRTKGDEISEELNISLYDANIFNLHYQNSFDKFKDFKESEHRKVYDFVATNTNIFRNNSSHKKCIAEFLTTFKKEKSTTLSDIQLKATIAAAYVEIKDTL